MRNLPEKKKKKKKKKRGKQRNEMNLINNEEANRFHKLIVATFSSNNIPLLWSGHNHLFVFSQQSNVKQIIK